MRRHRGVEGFPTIRSEGGLLPGDLLARVAGYDRSLEGMSPGAYHLAPGEKLGEAITRSWNRLRGAWVNFGDALDALPAEDHAATTLTRQRWSLVLFQELGYGQLQPAKAVEIEGKSYPISHGWGRVPIHLVGARVGIDTRTEGVVGAARMSPHSLVQEFLNRSDDHLWGIVTNGLDLRLLRDNAALTRQAYLQFDLRTMMATEQYADFAVLWLVCHESRLEGEIPEKCLLERWKDETAERGVRFHRQLRAAVTTAITELGTGFLRHRDNDDLRAALRNGDLSKQDYYRELLRVVYRVLFVLVAESRDLLLDPDADATAHERYRQDYSLDRVRRLADAGRGGPHGDLWAQVQLVFDGLGRRTGIPELGLPGLGSMLWAPWSTPHLNRAGLANRDLLAAMRALSWTVDGNVRRRVDYRNLASEELGSVYESLLEMHPELSVEEQRFRLATAAGNERKKTGSYYTPTSLVEQLLNTALDPVLDRAARSPDPEAAILGLTVLDPACGSGHFLIAAAQRIAKRLAVARTGDDEPPPPAIQHALREVVGRCIHGVDVNDMAVELCKVSLWLEAMEPGKPLSFLDHRIVHGNSLLGITPRLLDEGIPDAAYKPLTGDDKQVAAYYRKRNKEERGTGRGSGNLGQSRLLYTDTPADLQNAVAAEYEAIDAMPDRSVPEIEAKERRYSHLVRSSAYARTQMASDAWCSAFVARKTQGDPVPTTGFVRQALAHNVADLDREIVAEVVCLRNQYRFLHLHLAFPDVFRVPDEGQQPDNEKMGWSGGFDVVLGNPPWERVKLQEKEFFAQRSPEIASAPTAAARKSLIHQLADASPMSSDPDEAAQAELYAQFMAAVRQAEGESALLRWSDRYPLAGRGDVNTYAVFAEAMRDALAGAGRLGVIVPLGIATDDTTKHFFGDLVERGSLVSLLGFENEEFLFPDVDHRVTFGLVTVGGTNARTLDIQLLFFARQVTALAEPERRFTLSPEDFGLLNPNTRTCPIFRTRRDAEITKAVYRRVPVLITEGLANGNPWEVTLWTMFHMSGDSDLFRSCERLSEDSWELRGNVFERDGEFYLPLYEAKMLSFFDHRFGTYEGQTQAQANQGTLPRLSPGHQGDPAVVVQPRHWVPAREVGRRRAGGSGEHGYVLGWRKTVRSTDIRTSIPATAPFAGIGDKFQLVDVQTSLARTCLLQCALGSFVLDYVCRQKHGGTDLSFYALRQLPVPPPEWFDEPAGWDSAVTLAEWIKPRVLELTYTAWDMEAFGRDLGWKGPPFRWDDERRALMRAELDACFFHVYGIERDDVDYIMDTFPIVRRKDEAAFGEYRTKRLILEAYDAMARAATTGEPYRTTLSPPPADPSVAHPASTRPDWADLYLPERMRGHE